MANKHGSADHDLLDDSSSSVAFEAISSTSSLSSSIEILEVPDSPASSSSSSSSSVIEIVKVASPRGTTQNFQSKNDIANKHKSGAPIRQQKQEVNRKNKKKDSNKRPIEHKQRKQKQQDLTSPASSSSSSFIEFLKVECPSPKVRKLPFNDDNANKKKPVTSIEQKATAETQNVPASEKKDENKKSASNKQQNPMMQPTIVATQVLEQQQPTTVDHQNTAQSDIEVDLNTRNEEEEREKQQVGNKNQIKNSTFITIIKPLVQARPRHLGKRTPTELQNINKQQNPIMQPIITATQVSERQQTTTGNENTAQSDKEIELNARKEEAENEKEQVGNKNKVTNSKLITTIKRVVQARPRVLGKRTPTDLQNMNEQQNLIMQPVIMATQVLERQQPKTAAHENTAQSDEEIESNARKEEEGNENQQVGNNIKVDNSKSVTTNKPVVQATPRVLRKRPPTELKNINRAAKKIRRDYGNAQEEETKSSEMELSDISHGMIVWVRTRSGSTEEWQAKVDLEAKAADDKVVVRYLISGLWEEVLLSNVRLEEFKGHPRRKRLTPLERQKEEDLRLRKYVGAIDLEEENSKEGTEEVNTEKAAPKKKQSTRAVAKNKHTKNESKQSSRESESKKTAPKKKQKMPLKKKNVSQGNSNEKLATDKHTKNGSKQSNESEIKKISPIKKQKLAPKKNNVSKGKANKKEEKCAAKAKNTKSKPGIKSKKAPALESKAKKPKQQAQTAMLVHHHEEARLGRYYQFPERDGESNPRLYKCVGESNFFAKRYGKNFPRLLQFRSGGDTFYIDTSINSMPELVPRPLANVSPDHRNIATGSPKSKAKLSSANLPKQKRERKKRKDLQLSQKDRSNKSSLLKRCSAPSRHAPPPLEELETRKLSNDDASDITTDFITDENDDNISNIIQVEQQAQTAVKVYHHEEARLNRYYRFPERDGDINPKLYKCVGESNFFAKRWKKYPRLLQFRSGPDAFYLDTSVNPLPKLVPLPLANSSPLRRNITCGSPKSKAKQRSAHSPLQKENRQKEGPTNSAPSHRAMPPLKELETRKLSSDDESDITTEDATDETDNDSISFSDETAVIGLLCKGLFRQPDFRCV